MSDPISAVSAAGVSTQGLTRAAGADREAERLRKTAQEVEGVFLGILMKSMRSTVGNGGLFQKGADAQMYREMFDEEVGRVLARGGGIGLAQTILRALDRGPGSAEEPQAQEAPKVPGGADR